MLSVLNVMQIPQRACASFTANLRVGNENFCHRMEMTTNRNRKFYLMKPNFLF